MDLPQHVDVVVVGAGLSGIGAACHLSRECPERSMLVLESRDAVGGTWDLFRYPGIRSDSDMSTLGYRFRPWPSSTAIADGESILEYIRDTAREFGVLEKIRFGRRVMRADWDPERALWTLEVAALPAPDGGRPAQGAAAASSTLTCSFLYLCTGYYDYDQGYTPAIEGAADFTGEIVHPQSWPQDLDWTSKRVVVIGSGATAITLVPALAERAGHVTMLHRSPTYILSRPARDGLAGLLNRVLPSRLAASLVFWKNVLLAIALYESCRRWPAYLARMLRAAAARQLPAGFDLDRHLTPRYQPWDQRLCLAADGDFYKVISSGRASIATDQVERYEPGGLRLASGRFLPADVVVTATGLNLLAFGGIGLSVGGVPIDVGSTVAYQAMMLCGVPNLAWTIGYTNASWTLKADLVARHVCRILNHMSRHGYAVVEPLAPASGAEAPMIDLTSGYILRGREAFPKQGVRPPWRLRQNYLVDLWSMRRGAVDDHLHFAARPEQPVPGVATGAPIEPGRSSPAR